eukprot:CAMPEP_0196777842 /NCGR_PEP_ID=MMETSP1104-20130614/5459_1 /TAXON_ID=33652 /ORGANISM="Cafeteria sp., Strain Caron Lab Isolate" /LENGTH=163 /DNA_ID=CAMNT_0042148011 /DNA_START=74 /DNA_END=565 /DNA_ORIENTATION=+
MSDASFAGKPFPDVELHENTPGTKVSTAEFAKGRKVVFVGVPGAFTPTCHNTHLPGFLENLEKLKAAGVDEVACVAVNDAFVMSAWGKSLGTEGKIRMLADAKADLTKALGIELDATEALGNVRCKRFAAVVQDGQIKTMFLEPSGGGLEASTADNVLASLAE